MALQLNLQKSAGALRLSLEKAGIITPPVVELCFDLDVSGSYEDHHKSGATTKLLQRLIPWGMVFDPDKKLDVFTFSAGKEHAFYVGDINENNNDDFVRRNVIDRVPGWNGGTDYHFVLQKNLEQFGWLVPEVVAAAPARRGFLGFGRSSAPVAAPAPVALPPKRKSLVIFNTDGSNSDKSETLRLFERMEREKYGMYVMFIAIQQRGADFSFIKQLGDTFSNCGLTIIRDINEWVDRDDDAINRELITDELVTFLKAA